MSDNPQKILVIEDDQTINKLLVEKLNSRGYITLGANDGQLGIDMALKEHPDLILLDILLPTKDGIEVLEELRQDEWGKGANIIIMTNLTQDDKFADVYKHGVSDYLVKANWDLDDVVEKIQNSLENS